MEKIARATLRYLFQKYLKDPAVQYTINSISDLYKVDAVEVSNYLLEQKWIKERWIHSNGKVTCRITVSGIEEINPSFIHLKLKKLIGGLIEAGGQKSLNDIFSNRIEEYAIALDLVYQLEKLGYIKIRHIEGTINIELTPHGWKFFEKRDKPMYALMAVA
jgi:hypothetical protein